MRSFRLQHHFVFVKQVDCGCLKMASVFFRNMRMIAFTEKNMSVFHRSYCNSKQVDSKTSRYSKEAVKKNVRGYVFTRYIDHVKNYDKVLERNFPSAMRVYRVFLEGVAAFYKDMKRYLKITRILNGAAQGLLSLTRSELELYYQMPKDMYKVAPVILFSSLPLVGYAALPIAVLYPRVFLSSHFWTLQQKAEFQQLYLMERLSNNRNVFRCIQSKLDDLGGTPHYAIWNHIIGLLGSGQHPSIEEILGIRDLFASPPYQFSCLTQKHIKYLCLIHGLKPGLLAIFGRGRLLERAEIMYYMDRAIKREGGAHNMSPEALKYSCFIRGLNPANMNENSMIHWLRNWLEVSLNLEEQHTSLFLHLPILLGYNHPNNWQLIYK